MPALDRIDLTKTAVSDDVIPNGHKNGMSPQSAEAEPSSVDRESLRNEIQRHLEAMGLNGDRSGDVLSKEAIRHIHRFHREAAQRRIRRALGNKIERFLEEIANGDEVEPENIQPELIDVRSGRRTGDLFRFASLLWSVNSTSGCDRSAMMAGYA